MERFRRSWPLTSFVILLACLWLSYHPVVTFGTWDGVHLDGSLLYLLAIVAAASSLFMTWRQRRMLWQNKLWLLLVGFSAYVTLSILWSPNPFRAIVTSAFLWLMVGISIAAAIHFPALLKKRAVLRRILISGLIASCLWAVWQIFADAIGIHSAYTLLPDAYRSSVFGFARPTAFSLEPQFFASLLLAPFGWFLHRTLSERSWQDSIGLALTSCMLVLTMSRGGLLAASVIALIIATVYYRHWKSGVRMVVGVGIGTVTALLVMTGAASINQRDAISGRDALARSLNHLSLGMIDVPQESAAEKSEQPKRTTNATKKASDASDGYVKSSTTSRLSMSQKAVELWAEQPATFLFGVGVGGFGTALHERDPSQPVQSVTNNYFLEMLAELGLIGMALFASFIIWLLYRLAIRRQTLLLALIVGFLAQWCFFSGNANVIHVWVILGIALAVSTPLHKRRLLQ